MAKIFNDMISALGMEIVEDDEEKDGLDDSIYGDVKVVSKGRPKQKKRVVDDPVSTSVNLDEETPAEEFFDARKKIPTMRLFIVEPDNFEQVRDAADMLKEKKSVIINLEEVEYEDARKIIDFMSGNIYALGGTVHKISAGIILFAPDIMAVENLKNKQADNRAFPPEIERIKQEKTDRYRSSKESFHDEN